MKTTSVNRKSRSVNDYSAHKDAALIRFKYQQQNARSMSILSTTQAVMFNDIYHKMRIDVAIFAI